MTIISILYGCNKTQPMVHMISNNTHDIIKALEDKGIALLRQDYSEYKHTVSELPGKHLIYSTDEIGWHKIYTGSSLCESCSRLILIIELDLAVIDTNELIQKMKIF